MNYSRCSPKIQPIIPERRPGIFKHPDWVYELKHDGFRALAYIEKGLCRLVSRNGNQLNRFEDVSAAHGKELKVSNAVLDGEVAAVDESGMPAFYDLMKRKRQAVYFAFDLLWLNGRTFATYRWSSERRFYARSSLESLRALAT